MGTAKRIDEDKTVDLEIPESFRKKTQELKNENEKIEQALKNAKNEQAVRKVDESTKVFNLRQLELRNKITDLEALKKKTQKELMILVQRKNALFNNDLKKATEELVKETRKITQIDSDIESGVTKINSIKNEMQLMFEKSLEDRHKHGSIFQEQKKEISELVNLLKTATTDIRNEYREFQLTVRSNNQEILKLHQQKTELSFEVEKKIVESKRFDFIAEQVIKKKDELTEAEEKLIKLTQRLEELNQLILEKERVKDEIDGLGRFKNSLELEMKNLENKKALLSENVLKIENEIIEKESEISVKHKALLQAQKEQLFQEKNLEEIRKKTNETVNLRENLIDQVGSLKVEMARLKGEYDLFIQKQETVKNSYNEKAQKIEEELKSLDESYRQKLTDLKQDFERERQMIDEDFRAFQRDLEDKRSQELLKFSEEKQLWQDEFKSHCEKESLEQLKSVELINEKDLEIILKNKNAFRKEIIDLFELYLTRKSFFDSNAMVVEVRRKITKVFDHYFNKTQRWKFW